MATLRFETPSPGDAEQVVLRARWGDRTVPKRDDFRTYFPYAMGVTATAHQATFRIIGGVGTESYELNSTTRIQTATTHQDSGIAQNGLDTVSYFNANSAFNGWGAVLNGTATRLVQGMHQDLQGTNWMSLSDGVANQATLDAIVVPAVARYATNPAVIAYVFEDDLSANTTSAHRAGEAMNRIRELDAANRPASPSILSGDNLIDASAMNGILVFGAGRYPCRWISTGVKRVEGDFSISGGTDWADYARAYVLTYPNAHIWYWAQGHQLGDGSVFTLHLAYPTKREIRKQVWELIGSGVKGIVWFIYQDMPELPSIGLGNPGSRDRMDGVAEMGARITPGIRQRLLRSVPSATNTEFTASGGGSGGTWRYTNFANAYISTLRDVNSDTYYVVVCNRSLSSAAVTINSSTLSGNLINLETGSTIAVGGSVTLPALDGAIFRHAPASTFGVPHHIPDTSLSAEQWWLTHWANPASPNYVAPGAIPTHPNTVQVSAGSDLQAIVDAAPDNTTFVIQPGTYKGLFMVERRGLHFVAADPQNKPIIRGLFIFGHNLIRDTVNDGYAMFLQAVLNDQEPTAIAAWMNPKGDFLFRNIHFQCVPGVLSGDTPDPNMVSQEPWPGTNAPCFHTNVADVCYEMCDWTEWRMTTEGLAHHGGMVTASSGVYNVVVRNCTFRGELYSPGGSTAWPYAVYLDGAGGCVLIDNQLTGSYRSGAFFMPANNDFLPFQGDDYDGIPGYDPFYEIPHARWVAIVRNTGFRFTSIGAHNCLIAENVTTISGNIGTLIQIVANTANPGRAGIYDNVGTVVRDNTRTAGGGIATFVELNAVYGSPNTIGVAVVTGNQNPGGAVTKWVNAIGTFAGEVIPGSYTNNTDSTGTRDGV